jgi:hypothetical protein
LVARQVAAKFVRENREAKPPAVSFELAVPPFALATFVNQLPAQQVAAFAFGLERNQPERESWFYARREGDYLSEIGFKQKGEAAVHKERYR